MSSEDVIIVNLKVISSIQPNNRLNTNEHYLNIESDTLIPQAIKRWWREDSRHKCIKLIDQIIQDALSNDAIEIKTALEQSVNGLQNLKQTYCACNQTKARIDTIIDKITVSFDKDDEEFV